MPRKQAVAVRVAEGSIRVDGVLDDGAWSQAVPITDFIQKEPDEGAPPIEDTDVRVVYDSRALYIGARMHNRAASRSRPRWAGGTGSRSRPSTCWFRSTPFSTAGRPTRSA